jgi:hypothetical protein
MKYLEALKMQARFTWALPFVICNIHDSPAGTESGESPKPWKPIHFLVA